MLFEDRLGGQVYRPIGTDWFDEGYWAIYDHPATVQQYLTLDQGYRPQDGTPPLNMIEEVVEPQFEKPYVYYCRDIESNKLNKAVTLETFKTLPIDIVIASVPQHIEPFKKLIARYKPTAKLIFQVGNSWEGNYTNNIMASARVSLANIPNSVVYHQEFDVNIFKPKPGYSTGVNSFINCLNESSDWPLFLEVENLMPGTEFKSYGGQCRDGSISGSANLARAMQSAQFIWHVKPGGDGYGHVLFNAAACGKPLIVKKSYYVGKFGEDLMVDGETCINIDGMPATEIKAAIEFYSEPKRYAQICRNIYTKFKECVDFNAEEVKLREFLGRLL